MKWYYIVILILAILSILTAYKSVTPQHYSSGEISFDYPGLWNKQTPNQSNNTHNNPNATKNVVAIVDPNGDNVVVLVQKTKKSGTLNEIVAASKAELKKDWEAKMLSDDIITVDKRQGHNIIYEINSKNMSKKDRMVIFDKNNIVYCIILGSSPSAFDSQKKSFDLIVNSFKVDD